ncbi:MAG: RSP_2648 family PIN domain-containing protein [Paracoccaceae bacterium]
MAPRLLVDACVLYPQLLRALVVGAAGEGLIAAFWSPRVIEEWRLAAARRGGMEAEAAMRAAEADLARRFPDAMVAPDPGGEAALALPDAADVHVVAAAVAARADVLTANLRDFPARRLAPYGVGVRHPDGLLWALFSEAPDRLGPVIADALAALADEGEGGGRRALKRAGLPRLGKAWAGG